MFAAEGSGGLLEAWFSSPRSPRKARRADGRLPSAGGVGGFKSECGPDRNLSSRLRFNGVSVCRCTPNGTAVLTSFMLFTGLWYKRGPVSNQRGNVRQTGRDFFSFLFLKEMP